MDVAIVFLPLIGAIIAGFFGRLIGDKASMWTTCTLLGVAAVFSWILFFRVTGGKSLYRVSPIPPLELDTRTRPLNS